MTASSRLSGPFAVSTREALEGVTSAQTASEILSRALASAGHARVPEDITGFRVFVETALRAEVEQRLDSVAMVLVLERLGHVLWMATSDVHTLALAKGWSKGRPSTSDAADGDADASGEHPVLDRNGRRLPTIPPDSGKRPTLRAPSLEGASSSVPPRPRSPVPPRAPLVPRGISSVPPAPESPFARTPRTPLPPVQGSIARITSHGTPAPGRSVPSCVLVLSLDPLLAAQTTSELGGRCPVTSVGAPVELARVATRSGDRIVVLIDVALPSIELPMFVGLLPILPATTRVVLWGADARQHGRLASMFPQASNWVASNGSHSPGAFVLGLD